MKKVSFVTLHLSIGGAERVISLIANYCAKYNLEVQVITLSTEEVIYPIDNKIKHLHIKRTIKKPFHIIERIPKIRKAIKDSDIIVSFIWWNNICTILASLFLNKKIIISDRNDTESELKKYFNNPLIRKFAEILIKFLYRFATKVVFQTADAQNFYPNAIQKKSVVIPNPIVPYLPERYTGIRRKEIVAMCRLERQKNIKMMIDAYALLVQDYPEFTFIIYGEGELRWELEEYIENLSLKDKIFLPGFQKAIHERVVDIYMYVSSSDYEGISNSMLEALGMGLPSVVTDCPVGGARMFIKQNENGILVPVGNTQAMYEGMKKIIEDDEFREKISNNAIKIREEISVDIICKKWLDLIEE